MGVGRGTDPSPSGGAQGSSSVRFPLRSLCGAAATDLRVTQTRTTPRFTPSTGTEVSFVRFLIGGAIPCRSRHSFSALLPQGSSLGQAMNQPVSESSIVTHHLGAIIGLFTLVAINLACIGSFVLGWW